MTLTTLSFALLITIISAALTGRIRQEALRRDRLDHPNERSSHTVPTPSGGGLALVIAFLAALLPLWITGRMESSLAWALLVGGGVVATIGYLDDLRDLPARTRLLVHVGAALLGVALVGGMPPLTIGSQSLAWGILGHGVAVVGVVWLINLYNFMDGIDGIAAGEAVTVSAVIAAFLFADGRDAPAGVLVALAAANLGFLIWNWNPAKIFMGDVASGFLGYVLGILAITTAADAPHQLWSWLIVLGVFIVDATVTLVRRLARGDAWTQPHRTHAYQHATPLFGKHWIVTGGVLLINLFWLAPCAAIAWADSEVGVMVAAIALLPMLALAIILRAGLPHTN
jgi:Fuc2NAc and GlcNAc transferase